MTSALARAPAAGPGRSAANVQFVKDARDDASSLSSFADLVAPLAELSPVAREGERRARELLAQCDAKGRLPAAMAGAPSELLLALESALA